MLITTFFMICESQPVCLEVSYYQMGRRLTVEVGKFTDEVNGSLRRGIGGVLPFMFFYRDMNLKFSIDVNKRKNFFTLDV